MRAFGIATIILTITVAAVFTQTSTTATVTAEMRAAANDAYQKQNWQRAADEYGKIVLIESKNAGALYRLGVSELNLAKPKDARSHLEAAMAISPNPVFALALARAYVRNGESPKMYETLERSVALGGIGAETLQSEKDFDAVRSETKFADLVKRLDAAANPCRARPEFRQFDFWIGEWLPKNAQGVTVGTSSIQLILSSCVIFENWDTPVSSGKSFSLFDARDGKWHQTWVDARGNITHYAGGLVDDKMVLVADTTTGGKKSLAKMTFSKLPDGSVRQHGESSTDEGKTWTTAYDFTYVRKK